MNDKYDPDRPETTPVLTLIDNRSDLILDSKGPSRKVVIKFKAQTESDGVAYSDFG